jgi:hypothetical protein
VSGWLLRDLNGEDPYHLLGIDHTADDKAITRAYRQRIREVHPDLPSGNEERTKLLHIARDILLDPDARAEYDRRSTDEGAATDHAPSSSAWDGDDIFSGPKASPEQETWAPPPQPPRYTYPPQPQRPSPPPYQSPPVYAYPPQQQPAGAPQTGINSNMTMSIVSVFLFWPLAIPAIVYASKVDSALRVGDYATAQRAATDSRRWSRLAFVVGLVWMGLYLVCCCIGLLSQHAGQTSPIPP